MNYKVTESNKQVDSSRGRHRNGSDKFVIIE